MQEFSIAFFGVRSASSSMTLKRKASPDQVSFESGDALLGLDVATVKSGQRFPVHCVAEFELKSCKRQSISERKSDEKSREKSEGF